MRATFERSVEVCSHQATAMLKLQPKETALRLTGSLLAPKWAKVTYDVVHRADIAQTAYKLTSRAHGCSVVAATPFVEGRACGPLLSGSLSLVDALFERHIGPLGDLFASFSFQSRVLGAALSRQLGERSSLEAEAEVGPDGRKVAFGGALATACGPAGMDLEARAKVRDGELSLDCTVGYAAELAAGRTLRATLSPRPSGRLSAQISDRALEPGAAWIIQATAWPARRMPEVTVRRSCSF
mmetsp:Transcript_29014/g.95327  ORF Transcript_29014/g.95327 Transcript_29014/m.95327 type:complete len:241 (+) Transcript_29014:145-867(+)